MSFTSSYVMAGIGTFFILFWLFLYIKYRNAYGQVIDAILLQTLNIKPVLKRKKKAKPAMEERKLLSTRARSLRRRKMPRTTRHFRETFHRTFLTQW